jgi:hypothetical protein
MRRSSATHGGTRTSIRAVIAFSLIAVPALAQRQQQPAPAAPKNAAPAPRSALFETRGFAFEQVPRRTLQLLQYQRIWREIWTDGRPLPTNVGGAAKDARDPRYYGIPWDGGPMTIRSSSRPSASTKTHGPMNVALHAAWMRKSKSGTGGSITTTSSSA